jgi:hypothetical protein
MPPRHCRMASLVTGFNCLETRNPFLRIESWRASGYRVSARKHMETLTVAYSSSFLWKVMIDCKKIECMEANVRSTLSLLVLVVTALSMAGCGFVINLPSLTSRIEGSGNIISEAREVSSFTDIILSGAGDLTITQGEGHALTVRTDDNLMAYVKTEVVGDTLVLSFTDEARNKNLQPTQGWNYEITIEELEDLGISGAGAITSDSLQGDKLTITISGSGDIRLSDLRVEDLNLNIAGMGEVEMIGEAAQQRYTISGAGDVDAGDLQGEDVNVAIQGTGNITVWASEFLQVMIAGTGDVSYYGSPEVIQTILGLGNVISMGQK